MIFKPMFDNHQNSFQAFFGSESKRLSGSISEGLNAYGLQDSSGSRESAWAGSIDARAYSGSSFSVGGRTLIQGGLTSQAERDEVNGLLARSLYDRDQITGGRLYTNNSFAGSVSSSANESFATDRGDLLTNAIDVGRVVYRRDATIQGSIGHSYGGLRDSDDYYRFDLGKSGEVCLSLTGLSQNVGLALYSTSGSLLGFSDQSSNQSESIRLNLGVGAYVARAYSYGQAPWNHGASSYSLNISRSADALETYWRDMLVDSSIENAALNSIQTDSSLSRADVIGILKSAGDFGSVSGSELTDLRAFYNNAINTANVAADIKVLADKVVNTDPSNQWYTGSDSIRGSLGNLAANSSTDQLNLLIGKHFFGSDRPAIHRDASNNLAGTYRYANGSLFVGGASAADVIQGSTGDCYYLAALASTAEDKNVAINDMFRDNGDGTWTVRFYSNGKTDYVTVDRMMASAGNGSYLYANFGKQVSGNQELWVALAEKAYAQVNESGRIGQDGTNFYGNGNDNGIGWGFSSEATRQITGIASSSQSIAAYSQAALINLVASSRVVTIGGFNALATNSNAGPTQISSAVQGHAYAITGYDAASSRFTIHNPWGSRHLSLTYNQLLALGGLISASAS